MSIQSASFYWLACDAPDCEARSPDADDEIVSWSDEESAIVSAQASDWNRTSDGRDYCVDHAMHVCEARGCEKFDPTPLPGERDYLCVEHAS